MYVILKNNCDGDFVNFMIVLLEIDVVLVKVDCRFKLLFLFF